MPSVPSCPIQNCNRKPRSGPAAEGLCDAHYRRKLRGVELDQPMRATYVHGGRDEDGWTAWRVTKKGYVERSRVVNGRQQFQAKHRVVMGEAIGRPLMRHEEPHHKNGDRSDNRIENLELWSTRQPKGQRVEDKVEYAIEMLRLYRPELLR